MDRFTEFRVLLGTNEQIAFNECFVLIRDDGLLVVRSGEIQHIWPNGQWVSAHGKPALMLPR